MEAFKNRYVLECDLIIVIIVIIVFIDLKWRTIHENPTSRGKWRKWVCTTMKRKTYVVVVPNTTFDVVNHIIVIHGKGKNRIYWGFLP